MQFLESGLKVKEYKLVHRNLHVHDEEAGGGGQAEEVWEVIGVVDPTSTVVVIVRECS